MVELVVSTPVLIVLVAGMVFTGQQLRVYGSASQTTFNAALYAAGLSSFDPNNADITELAHVLLAAGVPSQVLLDGINADDFAVTYLDLNSDGRGDLVRVAYSGKLAGSPLGRFAGGGVGAVTTMPMLGDNLANSADPNFSNPSGVYCPDGSLQPLGGACPSSGGSGGSACGGCVAASDFCKPGSAVRVISPGGSKQVDKPAMQEHCLKSLAK
jgi:hypothetical protein